MENNKETKIIRQITKDFIEKHNIDINDMESVDKAITLAQAVIYEKKKKIVNIINKQFIASWDRDCINKAIDTLNDYNDIKSDLKNIYFEL